MIKCLHLIKNSLSKIKQKRQYKINDPKLKDLTKIQSFQQQTKQLRQKFEYKDNQARQKTFSQVLKEQRPKLKQRFKVDKQQLQKKFKKTINQQLNVQKIVPMQDDDAFSFLQSKSHIYDQSKEIEFEQKFRKQLFKKKQTNRLLQKQKNDFKNYLPQPKNKQYLKYEENKTKFKNSKIQSMMNFKRNNQQLRLLIDSGYIDNPENIKLIYKKLQETPKFQLQDHSDIKNTQNGRMNNNQSSDHQTQENKSQNLNFRQKSFSQTQSLKKQSNITNTNAIQQKNNQSITPEIQNLHNKMVQNLPGPAQLRNAKLLQQFFQKFNQSSQVQKQKAREDLQLLKDIKLFEDQIFESRYNAINFRFKGQVNFTWMKQNQLLSYIKTQRNQNTQPQALLSIFDQNKSKLNKFKQPVITPKVMSRIYSVCSLFQFPQSDQNNKINMLGDRKFIQLQKNLFKNIHQLSDQFFADAVFAYSKNHKQEQGVLKLKMNEKICESIYKELNQRIYTMPQQDLGLVLRSILQTPLMKNQQLNWENIIEILNQRIPSLQKDYQFQSCMTFLTLLPATQSSIQAVSQNIQKFKRYKWQFKQTLQSFLQCSSFMIRYQNNIPTHRRNKYVQQLKHIVHTKYEEIMPITQKVSINTMPQLVSVFYCLDSYRPRQASLELQIPNKLINKCKKQIIDNIRQQKQLIKRHTIGNITMSIAMTDYCKALIPKNLQLHQFPILKISLLKSLFSFRILPFNSINFFTYHQLTKLINVQIANLPVKTIVQTIFADSLVRYKNQGLIQQIMGKLTQKIHLQIKESGENQKIIHRKYMKEYAMIICSFHHTRSITEYYNFYLQKIIDNNASFLASLEPNLLIRFFESIICLSFTTDPKLDSDYFITKHFSDVFNLCYQNTLKPCLQFMSKQQLLLLQFINSMFLFTKVKNGQSSQNLKQINQMKNSYTQIGSKLQKLLQSTSLSTQQQYLRQLTSTMRIISQSISSNLNQNQNQLQKLINDKQLEQIQKRFYRHSIDQIMDQQQQIGSKLNYKVVYESISKKLANQNKEAMLEQKTWRIQNKSAKEVYFLATYEHLSAKYEDKNTVVRLFGIWRAYSELYALKNWKFKLVCTFLQG